MPAYLVQRTARLLAGAGLELAGSTVLLLGVAYKADVPDTRESTTLRVAATPLTAPGVYQVTVRFTSGALVHDNVVTIVVNAMGRRRVAGR